MKTASKVFIILHLISFLVLTFLLFIPATNASSPLVQIVVQRIYEQTGQNIEASLVCSIYMGMAVTLLIFGGIMALLVSIFLPKPKPVFGFGVAMLILTLGLNLGTLGSALYLAWASEEKKKEAAQPKEKAVEAEVVSEEKDEVGNEAINNVESNIEESEGNSFNQTEGGFDGGGDSGGGDI